MKYTRFVGSAAAILALCTPAFASSVSTATASGTATIDGIHRISCNVRSVSYPMAQGQMVLGQILILSDSGPFAGIINASVAKTDFSTASGTPKAVVHSNQFWYADLSKSIPGVASSIVYSQAFCDVTLTKVGAKCYVGFIVRRAGDGVVLAASAPDLQLASPVQLVGAMSVSP